MKDKIIKDTLGHFGTNLFAQILSLIRGLVVAKFLGPFLFGIWNGLQLILHYSPYSNLGLTNAMDREYPYYVGKKERDRAERVKDTAFGSGILISLSLAVIIIITAFFLRERVSRVAMVGLLVMAVATFLQMFYSYYRELLRLEKKITSVNIAMLLFSVINCLFSILLVMRFKIYALYVALLLAYGISIGYILLNTKHYFRLRIELEQLRRLLKIGLPLMLIPLMSIILRTLDRLMILKFLSVRELGYYGIGILVINFILYLPIAIQFVTYPYLLERYGQTQEVGALREYLIPPTLFLSCLIPFLIGIILIVIHLPINYLLPRFIPGLTAIKIVITGTFFFSLVFLPVNFLVALKKHRKVILIQVLCITLNATLNYILISMGMGIRGVALGTVIAYLLLGTLTVGYAVKHFIEKKAALFKFFVKIYVPFIYALGVFLLLNLFVVKNITTLKDDILITSLRLLLFVVLSSPWLYYAGKKANIFNNVYQIILAGQIKR